MNEFGFDNLVIIAVVIIGTAIVVGLLWRLYDYLRRS